MLGLGGLRAWVASVSKPLPYTSNAFYLFGADLLLFIKSSIAWPPAGLPSIIWPWKPCPSGALDELYLTSDDWKWDNLWQSNAGPILVHGGLLVAQGFFLYGLFHFLFIRRLSAVFCIGYVIMFSIANIYVCQKLLSGPPGQSFYAGREFASNPQDAGENWVSKDRSHEGEKWVFINGIAVGTHWMNSNLVRLSKTFRRPILGIHNPSYGIPVDVLESMLQRTFSYPTLDIRNAYKTVSDLLCEDSIKKLVLIAHSQGAIETGMILDWIYTTMPMKNVSKLEVFTFGNAANHWNNPMGVDDKPVIEHMEHYVNDGEWVARFGILHFRQLRGNTTIVGEQESALMHTPPASRDIRPQTPNMPADKVKKKSTSELESEKWEKDRFKGRMFKRTNCTGHQMNQHYLDNMFVMDGKLEQVLDWEKDHESTRFMEMEMDQDALESDDIVVPVVAGKQQDKHEKVKDHSRLWEYRNGMTPEDWMFHDRKTQ